MTRRLWLLRHGPTHLKAAIGWTDAPADLSDTAQIERLAAALPKDAILISSDLSRARETADAIARGQKRLPDAPGLREINFGDWEGKNFVEIEEEDGPLARQFWETPGDLCPPNGESWNVFAQRVTETTDQILARTDATDIIITAHFGVIIALLQQAAGMDAKAALVFEINNLSLTRIDRFAEQQGSRITLVNQTF